MTLFEAESRKDLSLFNTLAVPSHCSSYIKINEISDIVPAVGYAKKHNLPIRVLGGGSNLILSAHLNFCVFQFNSQIIECVSENKNSHTVRVAAGLNWHEFVQWSLIHSMYGLENLALIPGSVGACPVQNIGAYGVEVGEYILKVEVFDLITSEFKVLSRDECKFDYRDSFFKQEENRFLITHVWFELSKRFEPVLDYGPLKELKLSEDLTAQDVMEKVVTVRSEKLPDPSVIPNAGSFFKNPIVPSEMAEKLKKQFPELVVFPHENEFKLAAGWLIDSAGLRGCMSEAGVGSYEKQALVLINPKRADAEEIMAWAKHVIERVFDKFGVKLEIEPRTW